MNPYERNIMNHDDIYNMSDEEFAAHWNTAACRTALDIMHGKIED